MRDAPVVFSANGSIASLSRLKCLYDGTIVTTPYWKTIGDAPLVVRLGMIRSIPPDRHYVNLAALNRLNKPRHIRQPNKVGKLRRPHLSAHILDLAFLIERINADTDTTKCRPPLLEPWGKVDALSETF